ncbi:vacuolar protein sorting/targeting protein PEP1 [Coniosporium apollinis]|uniref:Vacuolar protein sorting/targeting protein 10 n=1 Tax=Coniosporium apollinis TaxID=61459 RepID=A0ABQ9P8Z8_9PEZI|nr:vacuolar protein sorting/targeting protein PEP1 [Coniosporium apollinis]
MKLLRSVLLPALLLVARSVAKKDAPAVTSHKFETQPGNLFYFDDSDVVLVTEFDRGVVWRSTDAGAKWSVVEDLAQGEPYAVLKHPFNGKLAVALGRKKRHWITKDQGKSWKEFKTDASPKNDPFSLPISFHADDPDKILFHGGDECDFYTCIGTTWYTKDGFDTMYKLTDKRKMCSWAKGTDSFTTGDATSDANRILCIVEGKYSHRTSDFRLLLTDDYFKDNHAVEPELAGGRVVAGLVNMAAVKGYLVAAAKSEGTDELALYVTDDTKTWHKAEFGQKLEQDAYTVLESTNYSIQVDVMTNKYAAIGELYTSNSNGTYFTRNIRNTNRNEAGFVDFEKMTNIQGIVLVNIVSNADKVKDSWFVEKEIQSRISFDDGRTFQALKAGDEDLHLHSVTDQRNVGRVFSSPAPGIVMGVGNTGKYLKPYSEGDLYVSDDAGVTWKRALKEAHKYEIGDKGAVLVAVYDEGHTEGFSYSLDHGGKWEQVSLDDKVRAHELTTVPDSTSLKFIMVATKGKGKSTEYHIYSINFEEMHKRKCEKDDFEMWPARVDKNGKKTCIMGRMQSYRRRKADKDCFVEADFQDPVPKWEICKCTKEDFECDYNFKAEWDDGNKKCVPAMPVPAPEGECKKPEDTFKGPSGWRLIPGNQCTKADVKLDEPVERKCGDTKHTPATGQIATKITEFHTGGFEEYWYLERKDSQDGTDETVVMLTTDRVAHISHDHGKTWKKAEVDDDKVSAIYPNPYQSDDVYFITPTKRIWYSKERALNKLHSFNAPEPPNADQQVLQFHPTQKDWLIFAGAQDCKASSGTCHAVSYASTKGGEDSSWKTLLKFTTKCQFMWRDRRQGSDKLVYCQQYQDEDTSKPKQLISSEDWFEHKHVELQDVVNFATMAEYVVVAQRTEDRKWLKVQASVDGKTFAHAHFPHGFQVEHSQAYTVLDSSTHAVFLHVTINGVKDQEYGTIIKSNSNGTSYVLSASFVNRDKDGYVDFEKMLGLEGVALINVVDNVKDVETKGAAKQLKSLITHNDGAAWDYIPRPDKDNEGKDYPCAGAGKEKCSLHLHGYTERKDVRNGFSSPTAVGLMMAVGNVGATLGRRKEGNTYITRDGGITWLEVMKGTFMWEYGDQGSVIVIVQEEVPTNIVYYTLDEGDHWTEHQFSEQKMQIAAISTVPSDNSLNFLLWGKDTSGSANLVTINLDFSGLKERSKICHLDDKNPEAADSDYYLWEPRHPKQKDNCLFGHVSQYHRKKLESQCRNDRNPIAKLHNIKKNCECTREDFECDYNYQRANEGSCVLVPGLQPANPERVCKENPDLIEFYDTTGYRRIPITTCEGGLEMDVSTPHPCPGHEKEFTEKRGLSGLGLFFAILLPFAAASGIGWYVYRNWDGKFGQIRLGDAAPSFDSGSPWIKWPVAAVAAIVAVVGAIPLLVGSLWRSVKGRVGGGYGGRTYTSRSSFAHGRGDYAVVDPDEGELLGEDSDEEV